MDTTPIVNLGGAGTNGDNNFFQSIIALAVLKSFGMGNEAAAAGNCVQNQMNQQSDLINSNFNNLSTQIASVNANDAMRDYFTSTNSAINGVESAVTTAGFNGIMATTTGSSNIIAAMNSGFSTSQLQACQIASEAQRVAFDNTQKILDQNANFRMIDQAATIASLSAQVNTLNQTAQIRTLIAEESAATALKIDVVQTRLNECCCNNNLAHATVSSTISNNDTLMVSLLNQIITNTKK